MQRKGARASLVALVGKRCVVGLQLLVIECALGRELEEFRDRKRWPEASEGAPGQKGVWENSNPLPEVGGVHAGMFAPFGK